MTMLVLCPRATCVSHNRQMFDLVPVIIGGNSAPVILCFAKGYLQLNR